MVRVQDKVAVFSSYRGVVLTSLVIFFMTVVFGATNLGN